MLRMMATKKSHRRLTITKPSVTFRSVSVNLSKAMVRPACIKAGWPAIIVAKCPIGQRQDSRM